MQKPPKPKKTKTKQKNPKKETYFQAWFQKELPKLVESHNSNDQILVLEFEDLGWGCGPMGTLDSLLKKKKRGRKEGGRKRRRTRIWRQDNMRNTL